jgi:hypothetical protein
MFMDEEKAARPLPCDSIIKEVKEIKEAKEIEVKEGTQGICWFEEQWKRYATMQIVAFVM